MVLSVRDERRHQLHFVDLLRLLLPAAGRVRVAIRAGLVGGDHFLRTGVDSDLHFCE